MDCLYGDIEWLVRFRTIDIDIHIDWLLEALQRLVTVSLSKMSPIMKFERGNLVRKPCATEGDSRADDH